MSHSVSTSSGLKAASAVVCASPSALHSVILVAGSDAATAIVYDNASAASGTVLCKLTAATGTTASFTPSFKFAANNGLYIALTGTGVGGIVGFEFG